MRWRDKRQRDNQPVKRRETLTPLIVRGAWYEVAVCQEVEAQADGRWQCDKRWHNNQRGAMRGGGGGVTRGDATTSRKSGGGGGGQWRWRWW